MNGIRSESVDTDREPAFDDGDSSPLRPDDPAAALVAGEGGSGRPIEVTSQ